MFELSNILNHLINDIMNYYVIYEYLTFKLN